MQILTQYFEHSVVLVIKMSPSLNMDFKCTHPKLEIGHKKQQVFATQKRWRQILYFCMFSVSYLIPVDVIWRFMSDTVAMKGEHYLNIFIVKFNQNPRNGSIF